MEFKEAMRTWKRMCKKHVRCFDCPMWGEVNECPGMLWNVETDAEAILVKWAEEHPERTIADDFFEKHPNAPGFDDKTPLVCAVHCGYIDKCPDGYTSLNCADCWRRLLEEAHHD